MWREEVFKQEWLYKNNIRQKRQERESHKEWSSYKERKGNALAPGAEEGRS